MELSEILKRYRKVMSRGQKQVADDLDISREHYAQIEEGHEFPSHPLLIKMRSLIGFGISYTFEHTRRKGRRPSERRRRRSSSRRRQTT